MNKWVLAGCGLAIAFGAVAAEAAVLVVRSSGPSAKAFPAGKAVPARLEAAGYESTAGHVARLARVEWSSDGGEPVATVGVPGGSIGRGSEGRQAGLRTTDDSRAGR